MFAVQSIVVLGWCLFPCNFCYGLHISQCQSNKPVEFNIDSRPSIEFTCTGIPVDQTVSWDIFGQRVANCNSTGQCTRTPSSLEWYRFFITRDRGYSRLIIELYGFQRFWRDRVLHNPPIKHSTVVCSTVGPISARATCDFDVTHSSQGAACTAQFNTPLDRQWTVTGKCDVRGVFSSRGRYSCLWTENRTETSVDINSTVSLADNEGYYYFGPIAKSMKCDFAKPFPSLTGNYTYSVVVSPGAEQPVVNFNGSSQIVLPSVPTTTCPHHDVNEGDDVDCTCNVSHPGIPPGSVAWKDRQGSRLILKDVRRSDHDQVYTCEVKWGVDVVRNTTFTLQVAGKSTIYDRDISSTVTTGARQLSTIVVVGITVGVMMVVVTVAVVGVVVWMWSRKWLLPCAAVTEGGENNSQNEGAVSGDAMSGTVDNPVNHVRDVSSRHSAAPVGAANVYEGLRHQEIGLRSLYSDISNYVDVDVNVDKESESNVYQNARQPSNQVYGNL